MLPVLGIELDDSSHDQKARQERDQFVDEVYKAAGLPLLHIRATATYDAKIIASLIRDAVRKKFVPKPVDASVVDAPNCPKCGTKMLLRWTKKGRKADAAFWGCRNFPVCEGIVKI